MWAVDQVRIGKRMSVIYIKIWGVRRSWQELWVGPGWEFSFTISGWTAKVHRLTESKRSPKPSMLKPEQTLERVEPTPSFYVLAKKRVWKPPGVLGWLKSFPSPLSSLPPLLHWIILLDIWDLMRQKCAGILGMVTSPLYTKPISMKSFPRRNMPVITKWCTVVCNIDNVPIGTSLNIL